MVFCLNELLLQETKESDIIDKKHNNEIRDFISFSPYRNSVILSSVKGSIFEMEFVVTTTMRL